MFPGRILAPKPAWVCRAGSLGVNGPRSSTIFKNIVDNLRNLWHTGPATWKRRWLLWKKQNVSQEKRAFLFGIWSCAPCLRPFWLWSAWLTVPGGGTLYIADLRRVCRLGAAGREAGTIAIALYLVLGAVGLPVFSGFRGGFGVLLGTTGGYIFGFLLSGLLYWALTALLGNRGLGPAVGHGPGSAAVLRRWNRLVSPGLPAKTGPISLGVVLAKCVVPFLLPDAVKLTLAWLLSHRLARHVPLRAMCPAGPKAPPRQCITLGS